jgi:hypothetical protein
VSVGHIRKKIESMVTLSNGKCAEGRIGHGLVLNSFLAWFKESFLSARDCSLLQD